MDERSNRRLLLLIAGLVLVLVAVSTLTLKQFARDIDELIRWSLLLGVSFNVVMLLFTALIVVGHFEPRPVARCVALVLGCKVIETVLTASGFVLTGNAESFGKGLVAAGLGSPLASVLHVIGALVVAQVLRDMVMGRRLGLEAPPKPDTAALERAALGLLEQTEDEDEVEDEVQVEVEDEDEVEVEDGDEPDRVVAAVAPATADLEAMPDLPSLEPSAEEEAVVEQVTVPEEVAASEEVAAPEEMAVPEEATAEEPLVEVSAAEAPAAEAPAAEAPSAEAADGGPAEIRLSVGEVLGCFRPEDVALTASEVVQERGGDDVVRVPLDVVVPQLATGVVRVAPELIMTQLPRSAFSRSAEEIASKLWRGKVELPLERVVAQVPSDAMVRAYEAEQAGADEFPDPFMDTLASPEAVAAGAGEEREEAPVEAAQVTPAAEPAPGAAAVTGGAPSPGAPSGVLSVNVEYIVAQFPENAMAMAIEDIESKLDPPGKLQVYVEDVLPQLAEGHVAVDVRPLLEQLPAGATAMSWEEIAAALPEGKVELPLEAVVGQLPADALAPGAAQHEQAAAEEIPEPFEEVAAGPVEAAGPAPAHPVAEAPLQPGPGEVPEAAAEAPEAAEAVEIGWGDLLPQFPADAFSVSRGQLATALEGKVARIDVNLVRAQIGDGGVTVPCGYVLAQFPGEYLELSVEQIAERVPGGRFEIPLASVVEQLSPEDLALPTEQVVQESAEEIPTVFAEVGAEAAAGGEAAEVEEPVGAPGAESEPDTEKMRPEELPVPAAGSELTQEDVAQLESLLAGQRREGVEREGEFIDELFGLDQADEVLGAAAPAAEPGVVDKEAEAAAGRVAGAAGDSEAFREVLEGYSQYHIEDGGAYLEEGRLVLAFVPPEISGEKLAHELPPRLDALAGLAEQLGCGALKGAVLAVGKGVIVCQWVPMETGRGLVVMATTEKQAAGIVHLRAQRDTELLSRLSTGFGFALEAAGDRPLELEPEACEVERLDGHPYDEIEGLLGAYEVRTVARLRFASGARWVLASCVDLDEHGRSGGAPSTGPGQSCYNPDTLVQLPEALRLGQVRSVLAMAERNIITVNAPPAGDGAGLICVFPGQFREGLLKMKAARASALLSGA